MTIRVLPADEWMVLETVFTQQKGEIPDPELARVLVAEDGEALLGFLVIQLQAHLEPIWVDVKHRGTGVSLALARAARAQFPAGAPFYAFAPNPLIEALAMKAGLVKLPWTVFQGFGV